MDIQKKSIRLRPTGENRLRFILMISRYFKVIGSYENSILEKTGSTNQSSKNLHTDFKTMSLNKASMYILQ